MGYDSATDMKRYNYNLWVQQFGEASLDFDEREALKEIKRKKRKLKQQLKDEYYDYTPKTKSANKRKVRQKGRVNKKSNRQQKPKVRQKRK